MAGGDPTESTESRLGAFVSGLNRSDREFVRDLLTELDAPASYVGAADPATEVERKRRELRAAIAEIFAEFYGGATRRRTAPTFSPGTGTSTRPAPGHVSVICRRFRR